MTEINRYELKRPGDGPQYLQPHTSGYWCKWEDVQKLQEELRDMTAKAFAAVWLIPENAIVRELKELREEARGVLMGKDKQLIAKLRNELQHAQEDRQMQRSPQLGINAVFGKYSKDLSPHVRYALMLTSVRTAANGGLEIEVQLP